MHVAHDCHWGFWDVFSHGSSGQYWPTAKPLLCYGLHPSGWWYATNTCMLVGGELCQCLLLIGNICNLFLLHMSLFITAACVTIFFPYWDEP